MKNILDIWNFIVHSNAFNFIVMVLLLSWIINKINLKESLNVMKNNIIDKIENSKSEKESANKILDDAKEQVKNLGTEIQNRLKQAENHGQDLAEKIFKDTELKIKQIENNIEKVIDTEEKTLSADLTKKTVKASVELAVKQVQNILANNPQLHEKFINESIDEIDRIKL